MRVVQISRSLDPTRGIAYVAFHLARELRRAGVEVTNLTWSPPGSAAGADLGASAPRPAVAALTRRIRNPHLRLALEVPLFTLWATRAARRLRAPGTVVLSHGDSLSGDLFVAHSCHRAAIAAKRAAGEWAWAFYPLHGFVLLREAWVFGRRRRPWLVSISRGVGREYRRYYGMPEERMIHIPNAVDHERFRPAGDRAALRRELGLPERETLLLFVGHEFARKGLRLIIEGLAACRAAVRPILLVAGADRPDAYRARARELGVGERVRFLGARADLHRLYPACDLFVLLSNYEAFPLVGLEALACGLPVVTTRVNGLEDCIRHGENGLIVERTAEAFGAALGRVLDDGALLARLRANARPSSEVYSWTAVARRYRAALERLGAGGSCGATTCD